MTLTIKIIFLVLDLIQILCMLWELFGDRIKLRSDHKVSCSAA